MDVARSAALFIAGLAGRLRLAAMKPAPGGALSTMTQAGQRPGDGMNANQKPVGADEIELPPTGGGHRRQAGYSQASSSPAPGAPRPAVALSTTSAGLLAHGSIPLALSSRALAGSVTHLTQTRARQTGQRLAADSCGGSRRLAPGRMSCRSARRSLFTRSRGTDDALPYRYDCTCGKLSQRSRNQTEGRADARTDGASSVWWWL